MFLDDGNKEKSMVVPRESLRQVPLAVRQEGIEALNKESNCLECQEE